MVMASGCRYTTQIATRQLADNVSRAILNSHDPATVKQGAPAYMILMDSLIEGDPDQQNLLLTGARLYDAYATVFVGDTLRARRLTDKAWEYSLRALCLEHPGKCQDYRKPYAEYVNFLAAMTPSDVGVLYNFAASWASWVQAHEDDWKAKADLPKIEATMKRVIDLDETYRQGDPYLYLGVLSILLPPALGGRPEQAYDYFQRAIVLSEGRNLMYKVIFAERYGRMLFNRKLHDRLLHEVVAADPVAPDLTLMNIIAQKKAADLLNSADEYF